MTPILERLHLTFKNFSFPQLLPFDFHATLASELSKSQFYTSCLMVDPHFVRRGCAGPTKFAFCHVFVCPTCAISAEGCPCSKEIHIPPHAWAFETHDLRRRLLRAKKFRISPHHMFAHPTCTISAEGCPRTNKTRISPHVWVSDTPQRVTYRKPPPGCRCRQNPYPLKNGI